MTAPRSAASVAEEAARARAIADDLARQAAELSRAEKLARTPREPELEPGLPQFVMFTKYQSGRVYSYAAVGWTAEVARSAAAARRGDVRLQNRWAVTGQEDRRFNWPGLLKFVGEANWASLRLFTDAEPLLAPGQEPEVAEVVGRFGRVERTEDVVSPVVGYGPGRFANGGRVGPYEG